MDDLYLIRLEELLLLATSHPDDPLWRGVLEFVKGQKANPDPHWSSVLWRWPGLIPVRFLFNAYKNETSRVFREEIENALHRALLAIWDDGYMGIFKKEGNWSPEELEEMEAMLDDD